MGSNVEGASYITIKKAFGITMKEVSYITQVAIIKGSLKHEMPWVTFTKMQMFLLRTLFFLMFCPQNWSSSCLEVTGEATFHFCKISTWTEVAHRQVAAHWSRPGSWWTRTRLAPGREQQRRSYSCNLWRWQHLGGALQTIDWRFWEAPTPVTMPTLAQKSFSIRKHQGQQSNSRHFTILSLQGSGGVQVNGRTKPEAPLPSVDIHFFACRW